MNILTLSNDLFEEITKARSKAICYWLDLKVEVMLSSPFPSTWKVTVKGDIDSKTARQCYTLFLSERGKSMDPGILSTQTTIGKGISEFYNKLLVLFDQAPWTDAQLVHAWDALSDVPVDPETEELGESFLHFPSGTYKEDIWHFFDQRYSGGVHALLYENEDCHDKLSLAEEKRSFARRFGNDVTAQMAINALEASLLDPSVQAVTIPVGWLNELLDHAMVKTYAADCEALKNYLREESLYRLRERLGISDPREDLVNACADRLCSHSDAIFNVEYIDDTLREIAGDYGEWEEE